jgi:hypothetical protein
MSGQGSAPHEQALPLSRPTDVGWDAQGNIFVTDGYGDDRVVKTQERALHRRPAPLATAPASSACRI